MRRKGSIEIELADTSVSVGQEVSGRVVLKAKKPLEGKELWVALVCEGDDGVGHDMERAWKEFHREQMTLHGSGDWEAGSEATFEFSVTIPPAPAPPPEADADAGMLGRASARRAKKAHAKLNFRYRIDARLEARGLDLRESARLTVDGKKYRRTIVN